MLTDEVMEDAKTCGLNNREGVTQSQLVEFAKRQRQRESDRIKELEKIVARYQVLKDLALTPQIRKSFAISKYTGFEWEPYELGGINLDEELDKLIIEVLESDK